MSEKMLGYNVYATEKYVDEKLAGAGNVQPDWNQNDETAPDYIKNRTHWVEISETTSNTIEWDGNTEGLVVVEPTPGIEYYKVSDVVLEVSDLVGATVTFTEMGEVYSEELAYMEDTGTIILAPFVTIVKEDNTEFDGVIFPEAGIYFSKEDAYNYYVIKVEITSGAKPFPTIDEVVHLLDRKYLPEISWNDLTDKPFKNNVIIQEALPEGYPYYKDNYIIYEGNYAADVLNDIFDGGYVDSNIKSFYINHRFDIFPESKPLYIEIDGVNYDLNMNTHTNGSTSIGNFSIIDSENEDTGENFYIFHYGTSNMFETTLYFKEPGTHYIKFYVMGQKQAVPMPSDYLPNSNILNGNKIGSVKTIGAYDEIGEYAFAEGYNTIASSWSSHAEGTKTIAFGQSSHAEGRGHDYYGSIILSSSADEGIYTLKYTNSSAKIGRIIKYEDNYRKITNISDDGITITLDEALPYTSLVEVEVELLYGGIAFGNYSHTEGYETTASGNYSHAEGQRTIASGNSSHAEGQRTIASGNSSHAEGYETTASSDYQHVQGKYNVEDTEDKYAHIIGNGDTDNRSNAHTLDWEGNAWYQGDVYVGSTSGINKDEGSKKLATEEYVSTELANLVGSAPETLDTLGELATAFNENSEVVAVLNAAIENKANTTEVLFKTEQALTSEELAQVRKNLKFIGKDVEGQTFTINGVEYTASSNAEIFGDYDNNIAVGQWSIAEGSYTVAKGRASHAEGAYSQALNDGCHVEGYGTKATGYWSHAEGEMTIVSSYASHAEGSYCTLPDGTKRYGTASGYASHVEGGGCHTTGSCAHAEGLGATASGAQSHVEGRYTIAAGGAQHVEGIANIEDTADEFIHIAGNGTFNERSNAYTLDWNGNAWFAGDVYVDSTSGTNKDEGSKKLATEKYVDEKLSATGIPRLVTHTFPITATEEGQTVFPIDLDSFNSFTDTVMVQDGRTMLFPNVDFTVVGNTVVLTEGWSIDDTGGIYVFRIEMYYPLTNITITTPPAKTTYYQNEYFDVTGMVVTATYMDGTTKEITNYSYTPNGKLTSIGTNVITISYSENGITKTYELNIEVLFDETILQDFTYVNNGDDTYSLTGWKGTKNGVSSTEIVIPDSDAIIW